MKYWMLLLLPLVAGATEHVPWKLKGAQERIEKYRMGKCSLEVRLPDGSALPVGTRIELEQTKHAFHFGGSLCQARVLHKEESYPVYKERFANLFNYATIGFYWGSHERKPNSWKLQPYTEEAMAWAIEQEMTVRGHPLMWHNTAPPWIADTERDVKDLNRDIMEHVRMLVETYPQVAQWDLYNETPGIRLYPPQHGVRRWVESFGGPGPVTQRLVDEVRKVRPGRFFAVNHFTYKDPQYLKQIEYCVTNQVKFNAIGIQSHMHTQNRLWAEDQMWKTLEKYARFDKPIQLTEVSVLSCEPMTNSAQLVFWEAGVKAAAKAKQPLPIKESTPEMERYQAEFARDFYTLAFSHPGVEAIIWWTVSDKDPWRGMPAGLLDAEAKPKPAYEMLDKLINHEWRTKSQALVGKKRRVPVKGFYGSYSVKVKHKGKIFSGTFDLECNQDDVQHVVLTEMEGKTADAFHLEKIEGRDCLVAPDGKPFLTLGVNHVQNIFPNSFSGDREKECDAVFKNLTSWGFNTAGYGSPEPLCRRMPYLAPMYLTKNANYMPDSEFYYPDVFDPAVQEEIRNVIQYEVSKQLGNRNLIGYYWTDTPQWDLERAQRKRGTDWVSTLRELPASAPGKQRYEQFMKEGGTSDEDFLRLIARELYRVLGEETRRLHPEALIFGERYLINDHPDCVVEEALPYIDVLSIQPGGAEFNGAFFDRLHARFKKPILLCDHQCSFPTPDYPKTMWQQLESEEAVGQAYARYLKNAFEKSYIIGYHRCQYIDRCATHSGVLKQGMIREDGTPYKTLVRHIREANTKALRRFVEERK